MHAGLPTWLSLCDSCAPVVVMPLRPGMAVTLHTVTACRDDTRRVADAVGSSAGGAAGHQRVKSTTALAYLRPHVWFCALQRRFKKKKLSS